MQQRKMLLHFELACEAACGVRVWYAYALGVAAADISDGRGLESNR
jgi:hypothetical protein